MFVVEGVQDVTTDVAGPVLQSLSCDLHIDGSEEQSLSSFVEEFGKRTRRLFVPLSEQEIMQARESKYDLRPLGR